VIPAIITQLLTGQNKLKLGSLDPTRDFNYVKDTASGFIEIAKSDNCIGKDINIATGKEISIGELAKELIMQINPEAELVCDQQRLRPEKSEVNRLLGDNRKLKDLTAWQPGYSLQQGLAETIMWFRKNLHYYKTDRYNI
jgi:dTDP-glucose 4,6-dehydratase